MDILKLFHEFIEVAIVGVECAPCHVGALAKLLDIDRRKRHFAEEGFQSVYHGYLRLGQVFMLCSDFHTYRIVLFCLTTGKRASPCLNRGLSLEDIAKAENVSKAECARCFKRLIQTTPYAYLLSYRISKATELMHEGELNATVIARTVGFGSSSHFSTAFKKALGMTPKEYMNEVRKQLGREQLHVR